MVLCLSKCRFSSKYSIFSFFLIQLTEFSFLRYISSCTVTAGFLHLQLSRSDILLRLDINQWHMTTLRFCDKGRMKNSCLLLSLHTRYAFNILNDSTKEHDIVSDIKIIAHWMAWNIIIYCKKWTKAAFFNDVIDCCTKIFVPYIWNMIVKHTFNLPNTERTWFILCEQFINIQRYFSFIKCNM